MGLYQSGTRLRARVTDGGDGVRRFDTWYDLQLETPCAFRLAADGVRRCVPMGNAAYGPVGYLDAACSVPVTDYVDPQAAAPFIAVLGPRVSAPAAGCGADLIAAGAYDDYLVDAWRVGPEQPNRSALFHRDELGGACSQNLVSSGPVHLLEPVAAAQLVGATMTVEARGPSMAVEILTGDDGSHGLGQMFDTRLGRPCFPSWVYGVTNDYRCYAATARPTTETPQGCGSGALAACPDEILIDGGVCTPSFHSLAAAPCGSSGVAGFQFHELGAPFDPQGFPSLTSELVGTGRLQLVTTRPSDDDRALFVNPGLFAAQERYTPGSFFDTERQLPCDAAAFEDGTLRCLTSDALLDVIYADAACTIPIAVAPGPPESCATALLYTTPQLAFLRVPGRLYALGSVVARTDVYTSYAGPRTCDPASRPAMYYDLIPADPGMLAPLTTLTE